MPSIFNAIRITHHEIIAACPGKASKNRSNKRALLRGIVPAASILRSKTAGGNFAANLIYLKVSCKRGVSNILKLTKCLKGFRNGDAKTQKTHLKILSYVRCSNIFLYAFDVRIWARTIADGLAYSDKRMSALDILVVDGQRG